MIIPTIVMAGNLLNLINSILGKTIMDQDEEKEDKKADTL